MVSRYYFKDKGKIRLKQGFPFEPARASQGRFTSIPRSLKGLRHGDFADFWSKLF